eukprot:3571353-Rhodomonas_salina.8
MTCYAMSGTDIAHGLQRVQASVCWYLPTTCYAISGTELAYAAPCRHACNAIYRTDMLVSSYALAMQFPDAHAGLRRAWSPDSTGQFYPPQYRTSPSVQNALCQYRASRRLRMLGYPPTDTDIVMLVHPPTSGTDKVYAGLSSYSTPGTDRAYAAKVLGLICATGTPYDERVG